MHLYYPQTYIHRLQNVAVSQGYRIPSIISYKSSTQIKFLSLRHYNKPLSPNSASSTFSMIINSDVFAGLRNYLILLLIDLEILEKADFCNFSIYICWHFQPFCIFGIFFPNINVLVCLVFLLSKKNESKICLCSNSP